MKCKVGFCGEKVNQVDPQDVIEICDPHYFEWIHSAECEALRRNAPKNQTFEIYLRWRMGFLSDFLHRIEAEKRNSAPDDGDDGPIPTPETKLIKVRPLGRKERNEG